MTVEEFIPLPKQYIFATCNMARVRFFGGAAGGSKSRLLVEMLKDRALAYPGIEQIAFRRSTNDIKPLLREAMNVIPHDTSDGEERMAKLNRQDGTFTFLNKDPVHGPSILTFTHMWLEEYKERHRGPSYGTIAFDESTTFSDSQINFLETRLRTTISGVEPNLYLASNPTGVSHMQTMRKFLEPKPEDVMEITHYYPWSEAFELWIEIKTRYPQMQKQDREAIRQASMEWIAKANERGIGWREYDAETRKNKKKPDPYDVWIASPTESQIAHGVEEGHSRVFIPSKLEDNPYFGEDYLRQLAANTDKRLVQAYLDGNWHIFEGQFFRDFDEKRHVIDPIQPGRGWTVFGSMDHGYSDRALTAVYWHTINPVTNQVITFDEITMNQTEDREIARRVLARHPDLYLDYVAADPAMWKDGGSSGRTLGDRYIDWGVPMRPANNQRVTGWRICRTMLADDAETGEPRWVVTRNCPYLIETLPAAVEDEKNVEDVNSESDDHGIDAWRYGMVSVDGFSNIAMAQPVATGIYQPGVIGDVVYSQNDPLGSQYGFHKPFLTLDDIR